MKSLSNMIIVAGTGRHVGKTTFICELISHFSSLYEVTGIKISPHFHQLSYKNALICQPDQFIIRKELDAESGKDSSRMLKAGAHKVFYIEADDKHLSGAMDAIMREIVSNPVICESASLRRLIIPGLFIFIENKPVTRQDKNQDLKEKADIIIHTYKNSFNFNCRDFSFDGKRWKLLKTKG